ncbi:MAG: hypothetical protein RIQ56_679, partial [Candidatus Parcubacteria bacterium]
MAFAVLFAIASLVLFLVFWPFLQVLTLATVLAILFRAPFEELVILCRGYRTFAAMCAVALVTVFFVAPFFLLGSQLVSEAQSVYASANSGGKFMHVVQNSIEAPIQQYI